MVSKLFQVTDPRSQSLFSMAFPLSLLQYAYSFNLSYLYTSECPLCDHILGIADVVYKQQITAIFFFFSNRQNQEDQYSKKIKGKKKTHREASVGLFGFVLKCYFIDHFAFLTYDGEDGDDDDRR